MQTNTAPALEIITRKPGDHSATIRHNGTLFGVSVLEHHTFIQTKHHTIIWSGQEAPPADHLLQVRGVSHIASAHVYNHPEGHLCISPEEIQKHIRPGGNWTRADNIGRRHIPYSFGTCYPKRANGDEATESARKAICAAMEAAVTAFMETPEAAALRADYMLKEARRHVEAAESYLTKCEADTKDARANLKAARAKLTRLEVA